MYICRKSKGKALRSNCSCKSGILVSSVVFLCKTLYSCFKHVIFVFNVLFLYQTCYHYIECHILGSNVVFMCQTCYSSIQCRILDSNVVFMSQTYYRVVYVVGLWHWSTTCWIKVFNAKDNCLTFTHNNRRESIPRKLISLYDFKWYVHIYMWWVKHPQNE